MFYFRRQNTYNMCIFYWIQRTVKLCWKDSSSKRPIMWWWGCYLPWLTHSVSRSVSPRCHSLAHVWSTDVIMTSIMMMSFSPRCSKRERRTTADNGYAKGNEHKVFTLSCASQDYTRWHKNPGYWFKWPHCCHIATSGHAEQNFFQSEW